MKNDRHMAKSSQLHPVVYLGMVGFARHVTVVFHGSLLGFEGRPIWSLMRKSARPGCGSRNAAGKLGSRENLIRIKA